MAFVPIRRTVIQAINSSGQSFSPNVLTDITGWTETVDTDNTFDPATGIFVPLRSGLYKIELRVSFGPATWGAGQDFFAVFRRGATSFTQFIDGQGATYENVVQFSRVIQLTAGDTCRPAAQHATVSNKNLNNSGSGAYTTFDVIELGEAL